MKGWRQFLKRCYDAGAGRVLASRAFTHIEQFIISRGFKMQLGRRRTYQA
jgi:hypothetical protein